ncbi:hypothetical protein REPUB_Repub09cG0045900 [Reevesia pubescens]
MGIHFTLTAPHQSPLWGQNGTGTPLNRALEHSGSILVSAVISQGVVYSALHAEILAILHGIILAKDHGCLKVKVERDSLVAISYLSKLSSSLWEWQSVAMDISVLSSGFEDCSFHYVPRACNRLAHNLSKYECGMGSSYKWLGELPSNLCNPDL